MTSPGAYSKKVPPAFAYRPKFLAESLPWLSEHSGLHRFGKVPDYGVFALLAGLFFLEFFTYLRVEDYGPDSSTYIGAAKSLLYQGTYTFNYRPETLYPPGLSVVVAAAIAWFADCQAVYMRLMSIFGFLGLLVAYILIRTRIGPLTASLATLLLASCPYFYLLSTRMLGSDIPFLFTTFLALLLVEFISRSINRPGLTLILSAALAAGVFSSMMLRSVGVALVAALPVYVVYLILQRDRKLALALGILLLPAFLVGVVTQALWVRHIRTHQVSESVGEHTSTYFEQLSTKDPHRPELGNATVTDYLRRPSKYFVVHSAHVAELFTHLSWVDPRWFSPVVAFTYCFIFIGLVHLLWSSPSYSDFYFLFYIAFYLIWPYDVGARFMLPVAPLAIMYIFVGGRRVFSYLQSNPLQLVSYVGAVSATVLIVALFQTRDKLASLSMQAKLSFVFWFLLAASCGILFLLERRSLSQNQKSVTYLKYANTRRLGLASIGIVIFLIGGGIVQDFRLVPENLHPDPRKFPHAPTAAAGIWIRSHLSQTSVIMAEQGAILHEITGAHVIQFPATRDPEVIARLARDYRVSYLLVTPSGNRQPTETERLDALQKRYPDLLSRIHQDQEFGLFTFRQ